MAEILELRQENSKTLNVGGQTIGVVGIKKVFPIAVIIAFLLGLIGQFVWKMIYFPEPIIPVICEVSGFIILAGIAIWCMRDCNG